MTISKLVDFTEILPHDLTRVIFSQLSIKERLRIITLVCKRWLKLSCEDLVWKQDAMALNISPVEGKIKKQVVEFLKIEKATSVTTEDEIIKRITEIFKNASSNKAILVHYFSSSIENGHLYAFFKKNGYLSFSADTYRKLNTNNLLEIESDFVAKADIEIRIKGKKNADKGIKEAARNVRTRNCVAVREGFWAQPRPFSSLFTPAENKFCIQINNKFINGKFVQMVNDNIGFFNPCKGTQNTECVYSYNIDLNFSEKIANLLTTLFEFK